MTNIKEIQALMDKLFPIKYKESWDNVGLLVGSDKKEVRSILLALEVTDKVIDEAIEKKVDMIITHHPLIFKPLKSITTKDPIGNMVYRLIRNNISLYSAHTNLDSSLLGTNYYLAELLNLSNVQFLEQKSFQNFYKIEVFVPKSHLEVVRKALTKNHLGHINEYSDCTFEVDGIGQFKPNEKASPFIGTKGRIERVEEVKIEGIIDKKYLKTAIMEMKKVHPYEEVACNIIHLDIESEVYGIGVKGKLETTLYELADTLKRVLHKPVINVIGENKKINDIAIVTGSGSEYLYKSDADVLITSDIKYHEAQTALQRNLSMIDAGHYETESIYMNRLYELLTERLDASIYISKINCNPFTYR